MLSKACKIAPRRKINASNNTTNNTNYSNAINNTDFDLDEVECGVSNLSIEIWSKGTSRTRIEWLFE